MPDTKYTGQERVFVMTPRTVAEGGHLKIEIMALVRASTRVRTVSVYLRRMGGGAWNAPVTATLVPGAPGRQVYRVALDLSEDSEYFVQVATAADPKALQWPAGGAVNAHTVVVVPP